MFVVLDIKFVVWNYSCAQSYSEDTYTKHDLHAYNASMRLLTF